MAAFGAMAGIAVSLAGQRALQGFMYGVRASDPLLLAATTLGFLLVAATAALLPARSAARVDPMSALRQE